MSISRKYSRKREAILSKLRSTTAHPTAEWIYTELKSEIPDLSLGTVYRNLSIFKQEGVIQSVGVIGGQERYDGEVSSHPHHICIKCGSVTDIELDDDKIYIASVERRNKVAIERHEHVFYGRCTQCAEDHK